MPRVFTSRNHCADCLHKTFLLMGVNISICTIIRKTDRNFELNRLIKTQWHPERLCLRAVDYNNCVFNVILCVTWAWQRSSSGAVRDLIALYIWRRLHFISTWCLLDCRATARTLGILKVGAVAWRSRRLEDTAVLLI